MCCNQLTVGILFRKASWNMVVCLSRSSRIGSNGAELRSAYWPAFLSGNKSL